jgi:hypothetical protein
LALFAFLVAAPFRAAVERLAVDFRAVDFFGAAMVVPPFRLASSHPVLKRR